MRTLNVKQLERRLSKLEGGPKPAFQRIVVVFGDDASSESIALCISGRPNQKLPVTRDGINLRLDVPVQ